VQIESSLPPIAMTNADGTVTVQLGAVGVEVPPMPGAPVYGEGLSGSFSATMVARITGTSASGDPTFGEIEITELATGIATPLTRPDREQVESFMVLMAWHMTSFALNDGGPVMPTGSVETTTELEAYGLSAGTVLGTLGPVALPVDGSFALDGTFGEIVAPTM